MTEGRGIPQLAPEDAAEALSVARTSRTPIRPFTDTFPDLDEAWGYEVQDLDRSRRLEAGETIAGAKLGLTSEPKQQTMGISQPIVGFITTGMLLGDSPSYGLEQMIHPRGEPEIAFRLRDDFDRAMSFDEAAGLIEAMTVAIEIIDSRFEAFRFGLADVLADNTSAAGILLGEWASTENLEQLPATGCRLFVDEELKQEGLASAVLGHPLHSLVHLSEHLEARGDKLPAGSIVLSGSITDAVPLQKGSVHRLEMDGFSPVALSWS